jgi:hypothetical protein
MLNNSKKVLLFLIVASFIGTPFLSLAQNLEVDYIGEDPGNSLSEYVKYIFDISFGIAGLLAFLGLLYAGFQYIYSAGDPQKLSKSKKQILAAFIGLFIIVSSYSILVIINPDIIMLILPTLEEVEIIAPPSKLKEIRLSMLGSIKEIGYMGGEVMAEIGDQSKYISESILLCNCVFAKGLCLCDGGDENSNCEPAYCFAGTDGSGHPCSNYDKIKEEKEAMLFRLTELIHYKNKAVGSEFLKPLFQGGGGGSFSPDAGFGGTWESAETTAEDYVIEGLTGSGFGSLEGILGDISGLGGEALALQEEIDTVLIPKIKYYEKILDIQTDEQIVQTITDAKNHTEEEMELKEDLRDELIKFGALTMAIRYPIEQIASLPEQCAPNTQEQCEPKCIGECHDSYLGCRAVCIGLNPCPFLEIGAFYLQARVAEEGINDALEEIMETVDKIRQLKGQTI